jgi:solute carrier family 38 (sodium-coupled neutral amino acid transporter), member 11
MDSLFNPRKAVHFALDSDEEDGDLPPTTPSHQPSTSRLDNHSSSTQPQPSPSASSPTAYSDQPNSPLFDLDTDDDPAHHDESSYYPPQPLKSTYPSREAQFDLDSDDIDTDDHEQLEEPLMEGLLQKRSSGERSRRGEGKDIEREGGAEQPPDWLTKGAGVFAGIANMSNSILGAGIIGEYRLVLFYSRAEFQTPS